MKCEIDRNLYDKMLKVAGLHIISNESTMPVIFTISNKSKIKNKAIDKKIMQLMIVVAPHLHPILMHL